MARILVVDDDPDFCEILRLILQSRGYTVETASNGSMALRMMRASPPSLVLLDVMMADVLDGLHVAHTMRADAALRQVPVIMVSSIADSDQSALFPTNEYIPIDMWVSKPVQPEDLLRRIDRLVGERTA
ncbi:MAG: response regulator [Anaerolineae bacterium]